MAFFDTTQSRVILIGSMLYVLSLALVALVKRKFTDTKVLYALIFSFLNGLVLAHAANCMLWGDCNKMVYVFILFVFVSMIGSGISFYNNVLSNKEEGYGYNYRANEWVPYMWDGVRF